MKCQLKQIPRSLIALLVSGCLIGCQSAAQRGTDIAEVPSEYQIEWLEKIPMQDCRWVIPPWERQGRLVFSGLIRGDNGIEVLRKSAEPFSQLSVYGSDVGPSSVSVVLEDGSITNTAPAPGMIYWCRGEFGDRFVELVLDADNRISGFVLLTN